jgi:outer membrane immunogenic protein
MSKLFHTVVAFLVLLLASVGANAAEKRIPVKAPPAPPPPPPFTWTGFYIGGNIGGTWAGTHWTDSFFGLDWGRRSDARFMGGGQVGFNYQFAGYNYNYSGASFVLGAEAQFDWVSNDSSGGVIAVGPFGHGFLIVSNGTRITTAAARLGFAFNRALFYGKVGGGWVGNNGFTVTDLTTGQVFTGDSGTLSGWMAGGGIEYAFTDYWSGKFEYDFIGLGSRTFTLPGVIIPALAGDTITSNNNVQLVKVGINYRFNWGILGPTRY